MVFLTGHVILGKHCPPQFVMLHSIHGCCFVNSKEFITCRGRSWSQKESCAQLLSHHAHLGHTGPGLAMVGDIWDNTPGAIAIPPGGTSSPKKLGHEKHDKYDRDIAQLYDKWHSLNGQATCQRASLPSNRRLPFHSVEALQDSVTAEFLLRYK